MDAAPSTASTKLFSPTQPIYLNDQLHIQRNRYTRSSDTVTLQRPSVRSILKLTDRSFTHNAPVLWNSLPMQAASPINQRIINPASNRLHSGSIFVSVSCETQNIPLHSIIPSLVCMHYPSCQFSGFLTRQCSSSHICFHFNSVIYFIVCRNMKCRPVYFVGGQ